MQLVTYRDEAGVHLGALRGQVVVALDSVAPDMLALIDAGPDGLARAAAVLAKTPAGVPLDSVQLLAPIPRPRQNVVCVGMNYVAHALEAARALGRDPKLPEAPVFFTKAPTTVCGPDTPFVLDPRVTQKLDYEVELAFVIGPGGRNISREAAAQHIFGYTLVNDLSARDLQQRHQQFFKGKSLDGGCPMGPCLVTADEIPNPADLHVRLFVNGEKRQDSAVSDLIFDVPALIEALSRGMTLEAGTIVATGTPSGVALGYAEPPYLQPGDVVEAELDCVGRLRTPIVGVA